METKTLVELRDLLAKARCPGGEPPSRGTPPGESGPYLASKDGRNEIIVGRFDYASDFDKPLIAALRNNADELLNTLDAQTNTINRLLKALNEITSYPDNGRYDIRNIAFAAIAEWRGSQK